MSFDGAEFGREIVAAVRGYVDRVVSPLLAKLDEIERRIAEMPVPRDGRDADEAAIAARVSENLVVHVAEEVRRAVPPAVAEAVAAIPVPRDGRDGRDADPETVARLVADLVADGLQRAISALPPPPPAPGVDKAEVEAMVKAAVDALPPPRDGKDGRSVTPEELAPMVAEEVRRAVAALPPPNDGVGVAGAVIDRDGCLVLTLSDGDVKNLGPVVGRDADQAAIAEMVRAEVAKIPPPKDGRDGFGFEDLTVEHDGERGVTLRFVRGEETKEFAFRLPVVLDRGIWREGTAYEKGDAVTWGGSLWIAQQDGVTDKPDAGGPGWRLAVKRGRDGKDGTVVPRAPVGPIKGAGL